MKQTLFEEITDGLVINHVIRDYEFTMPCKHFHPEYEIYYLLKGERNYFIDNQTYLIHKGSIVFIDRNQIHKTSLGSSPFHERIVIELNSTHLEPLFPSLSDFSLTSFFSKHWGVVQLDTEAQHHVEQLLFGIAQEIHLKATNYKLMTYIRLAELLIYITRYKENIDNIFLTSMTSQTVKHQKIHELALYITQHYAAITSLEDLANNFYISKCHLSRSFKEVTGFTVNEYINITKIKQAQNLLVSSNYKIAEIASQLGYQNVTYFQKLFKKYTETTPLKYRQRLTLYSQQIRDQRAE